MNAEFIQYEQALALKELGFDEECFRYYHTDKTLRSESEGSYNEKCSAPTYSQAFRWFRDKQKLDKIIENWSEQPVNNELWPKAYQYYISGVAYHPYFKTHEEAELECLKTLIELVKNK